MGGYFLPVRWPENCYIGLNEPMLPVPDNILLWTREHFAPEECRMWRHHRFLLLLSHDGEADVVIDGRQCEFGGGSALLVFPFQNHEFRIHSDAIQWTIITFALPDNCGLEGLRNDCREFAEPLQEQCAELSRLFLQLAGASGPAPADLRLQRDEFRLRLGLFLVRLGQAPSLYRNVTAGSAPESHKTFMLDRVHECIFQQQKYLLSNEELAAAIGTSVSTLRRAVKREAGMPLAEYLRYLRLNYACGLLRDRRHSVAEAAALCGYSSIYAFSFAFKHYFGFAPSMYCRERTPPASGGSSADSAPRK